MTNFIDGRMTNFISSVLSSMYNNVSLIVGSSSFFHKNC